MSDYMKAKDLAEQRGELVTKMRAMTQAVADEGRPMTDDEIATFDRMEADEVDLLKQIETAKRFDKVGGLKEAIEKTNFTANPKTVSNSRVTYKDEVNALRYWLGKNSSPRENVDAYERKMGAWKESADKVSQFAKDRNSVSFNFPAEYTAFSSTLPLSHATTGGPDSGYLLPTLLATSIDIALKSVSGMRQAARVIKTADGNTFNWPTTDDTTSVGVRLAGSGDNQNRATVADPVFGVRTFNAYTYSSNACLVPMELLQDVGYDLPGHIASQLGKRIGRAHNNEFTTLSSTAGGPVGLLSATGGAANSGFTTASKLAMTYGFVEDVIHSIDPDYRRMPSFRLMFNDLTHKVLKKMTDNNGRPIWLPANYGVPTVAGVGADTICDHEYVINTSMTGFGSSNVGGKFFVAGDFNEYVIRDVLDFTVQRLNELYAAAGQVGFLGFSRNDGKLIGPASCMAYGAVGSST